MRLLNHLTGAPFPFKQYLMSVSLWWGGGGVAYLLQLKVKNQILDSSMRFSVL